MLSKNTIKHIHSLRQVKYRKKLNEFIAEGNTIVKDFIKSNLQIIKIIANEDWIKNNKSLIKGVPFEIVSKNDMSRITFLKNPSEVLAIINKPEFTLPDVEDSQNYILALDKIKDPGNLGTIIRTADWFGIKDIVCSKETVDAFNPKVIQATMGSISRVKVHYYPLKEFLKEANGKIKVFGATLKGKPIQDIPKAKKGILLIGSEAHGISKELYPYINEEIFIPSAANSKAESLNAAVATALICYSFIL